MALTHTKGTAINTHQAVFLLFVILALALQACTTNKKVYESNCNDNTAFKKISFSKLIDSIELYDQQYIEVQGTYVEGKEESAMFNDSTFVDHSSGHALWINFSQDCPLYLKGTRTGLFESTDRGFTQMNDKQITIRGKVDVRHKGHLGSYRGSIDRVSYVKL